MSRSKDEFIQAKDAAIKFLIFKKRTEHEVLIKLMKKGYNNDIAAQVVDYLKQLEYLNDEIYTKKYIKDAVNIKKYGKRRIYNDLINKGVNKEIIIEKFNETDFNEVEYLKPMLEKKLLKLQHIDEKSLNKLRRYFYRRGFTTQDIDYCIDEVINV